MQVNGGATVGNSFVLLSQITRTRRGPPAARSGRRRRRAGGLPSLQRRQPHRGQAALWQKLAWFAMRCRVSDITLACQPSGMRGPQGSNDGQTAAAAVKEALDAGEDLGRLKLRIGSGPPRCAPRRINGLWVHARVPPTLTLSVCVPAGPPSPLKCGAARLSRPCRSLTLCSSCSGVWTERARSQVGGGVLPADLHYSPSQLLAVAPSVALLNNTVSY